MRLVGGNFSSDPTHRAANISTTQTDVAYSPFSEATEAQARTAFETGPSASAVDALGAGWVDVRTPEWFNNFTGFQNLPDSEIRTNKFLDEDEIADRKERDHYAQYMTIPKGGYTDWEYDIALEETRQRVIRESTMGRAPTGFIAGAKRLTVELAVGMADPTNILGAFIPRGAFFVASKTALAQTKAMKNLSKGIEDYAQALDDMSAMQRVGSRSKVGLVESVPGAALAEVPIYMGAHVRGEDYTAEDVFMSIGLGIIIDTGIHIGGGALYDVATIPARRIRKEKRNKEATELNDMLQTAHLMNDNFSTMQRFMGDLSPEDRAAVVQTGLAQMYNDVTIDMTAMTKLLQAKLDERLTPAQIRENVIKEFKARENDAAGEGVPERVMDADYDAAVSGSRAAIAKLEGELRGSVKSARSKAGKTGEIKSELEGELPQQAQRLEDELSGAGPTTRSKAGDTSRIRAELEEVKAKMRRLDIEFVARKTDNAIARTAKAKAELDAAHKKIETEIETEVQSRVEAAGSKDPNHMRDLLKQVQETMTDPKKKRSYVKGAEESQKKSGEKPTPEKEISELGEQMHDAIENAEHMAEGLGIEYKMDDGADAVIKEADDADVAMKNLHNCLNGVAA